MDNAIGFPNIYPVDSTIQLLINWGQDFKLSMDKVYEPTTDNYTKSGLTNESFSHVLNQVSRRQSSLWILCILKRVIRLTREIYHDYKIYQKKQKEQNLNLAKVLCNVKMHRKMRGKE